MPQQNYLRIDQINGESQIHGHEHEIEVINWNWTITHVGANTRAGAAGRPVVSGVTFSHYIDFASPPILKNCFSGTHSLRAVLSVNSNPDAPFDNFRLTMEEVKFTSIVLSAIDDCSRTIETVTMEFAKITEEYTKANTSGTAGDSLSVTIDVRNSRIV
jgi:type VI secretion system secreted protein Hcp